MKAYLSTGSNQQVDHCSLDVSPPYTELSRPSDVTFFMSQSDGTLGHAQFRPRPI